MDFSLHQFQNNFVENSPVKELVASLKITIPDIDYDSAKCYIDIATEQSLTGLAHSKNQNRNENSKE
jgi:hypothetical protein